ncbi:hypothetical protein Sjap_022227 [Stephania japonica]|uniref:Uncharacterized protein n=1 Tax=Stephania japonica TaxID=461633 RepID=A0AAP0ENJ2_9MAGN
MPLPSAISTLALSLMPLASTSISYAVSYFHNRRLSLLAFVVAAASHTFNASASPLSLLWSLSPTTATQKNDVSARKRFVFLNWSSLFSSSHYFSANDLFF